MRFRRPDWDVPMPASLQAYWTAWNEPDLEQIPHHLAKAVTPAVEWNDPRDSFIGMSEMVDAVRRLRTNKPDYVFAIVSEIDHHHQRLRYRWDMLRGNRILMEGLDVVTLDPASGLITRVDGFFGHPTPINGGDSGVPVALRDRSSTNQPTRGE
jgi:SnoaL-like domain